MLLVDPLSAVEVAENDAARVAFARLLDRDTKGSKVQSLLRDLLDAEDKRMRSIINSYTSTSPETTPAMMATHGEVYAARIALAAELVERDVI